MSSLTKRVWTNDKLTEHTKIQDYRACALSTLLYGSESWTLRAQQEKKLNAFQMRCLRRILHIIWQDKVTTNSVLERVGIPSSLLWLEHVVRMDDGRIPKDHLYGELAQGKAPTGRPQLHKGLEDHGYRPHQAGRQTDRQRISPASSAVGIATPASDFLVLPDFDAVSVSPPRAQLHSLPRLTGALPYNVCTFAKNIYSPNISISMIIKSFFSLSTRELRPVRNKIHTDKT